MSSPAPNSFTMSPHITTSNRSIPPAAAFRRPDGRPVAWAVSPGLTPYPAAVALMERQAQGIAEDKADELVWLLEHPPLYSAGVSAKDSDLLWPDRFPVFESGRGGQYTYHGPGQRVAYVMLDLRTRGRDARTFITSLESWLISTIARLGVRGEVRRERVGVWVQRNVGLASHREDKIAAIGVKLRRWVSFHGISLNVAPDLSHFSGIVPCGIADHGVTSLADLGFKGSMDDVDVALREAFEPVFGPVHPAPSPKWP
jgi:lipoyl(octanoyl) transferase